MGLEKSSKQPCVHDFFVNPVKNQSAVQTIIGNENVYNYSDVDLNLRKYLNEKAISEMINVNSEITNILSKFKISIKINMNILNNLAQNHLPQTRKTALGIANHLPHNFKPLVNHKALIEATTLHDIAKAIIPENIVNKEGSLTDDERKIMKEHATLSYELLKTTDLSEETLNLIKNHHHNPQKTDSPNVDEDFEVNINLQILSMADIYSALREKRSYKTEMSKEQALTIIDEETKQGKFHSAVYNALVAYADKEESLPKTKSKWQIFNFKFINSFWTQVFKCN